MANMTGNQLMTRLRNLRWYTLQIADKSVAILSFSGGLRSGGVEVKCGYGTRCSYGMALGFSSNNICRGTDYFGFPDGQHHAIDDETWDEGIARIERKIAHFLIGEVPDQNLAGLLENITKLRRL